MLKNAMLLIPDIIGRQDEERKNRYCKLLASYATVEGKRMFLSAVLPINLILSTSGANDVALFMLTKLMIDCPAVRPLIAMALREPLIDSAEFSLKQLQALLEKVNRFCCFGIHILLYLFIVERTPPPMERNSSARG